MRGRSQRRGRPVRRRGDDAVCARGSRRESEISSVITDKAAMEFAEEFFTPQLPTVSRSIRPWLRHAKPCWQRPTKWNGERRSFSRIASGVLFDLQAEVVGQQSVERDTAARDEQRAEAPVTSKALEDWADEVEKTATESRGQKRVSARLWSTNRQGGGKPPTTAHRSMDQCADCVLCAEMGKQRSPSSKRSWNSMRITKMLRRNWPKRSRNNGWQLGTPPRS